MPSNKAIFPGPRFEFSAKSIRNRINGTCFIISLASMRHRFVIPKMYSACYTVNSIPKQDRNVARGAPSRTVWSGPHNSYMRFREVKSPNRFDRMEWAGAFGDLGTLIPFVVAYLAVVKMEPFGVLFSFGA